MTSVPSDAAERQRGSRFNESSQFAAPGVTTARPACHRPYSGGASKRIGRRRDHLIQAGLIDDVRESLFEGRSGGIGPDDRGAGAGEWHQRAFDLHGRLRIDAWHAEAGPSDRHAPLTQSRRNVDPQAERQRFEVPALAGAELPRVVDGQLHLRRRGRGQRPCRGERVDRDQVAVQDRLSETGLASELEGRNHTREVVRVWRQQSRTDEPRQRQMRRAIQRRAHRVRIARVVGRRLPVGPGPAVLQVGQLEERPGRRRNPEHRQWRVAPRS